MLCFVNDPVLFYFFVLMVTGGRAGMEDQAGQDVISYYVFSWIVLFYFLQFALVYECFVALCLLLGSLYCILIFAAICFWVVVMLWGLFKALGWWKQYVGCEFFRGFVSG